MQSSPRRFVESNNRPMRRQVNALQHAQRRETFPRTALAHARLAEFGRCGVELPAEDSVEMALVGESAEQRNLLQREPVLAQVLACALHLAVQNVGMRPHAVVSVEFARELDWRAVADAGQLLQRDVPADVLLDIVLDQPRMCRPEATL